MSGALGTFILNYLPIKPPQEVEVDQTTLSSRHGRSSPIGMDGEETLSLNLGFRAGANWCDKHSA